MGSWTGSSVDLDLNLVFVGTSVTSPAPKCPAGRIEHTHLYHNSTLALDAAPARSAGYYQHLHNDWDLDHPFKRLLVATAVAPDPDAVSCIPGKTGVVATSTARPASSCVDQPDRRPGRDQPHQWRHRRRDREPRGALLAPRPGAAGGKDWESVYGSAEIPIDPIYIG